MPAWAALLPVAPRCDDGLRGPVRLVVHLHRPRIRGAGGTGLCCWCARVGCGAATSGRYRIRAAWDRGIAAAQKITGRGYGGPSKDAIASKALYARDYRVGFDSNPQACIIQRRWMR